MAYTGQWLTSGPPWPPSVDWCGSVTAGHDSLGKSYTPDFGISRSQPCSISAIHFSTGRWSKLIVEIIPVLALKFSPHEGRGKSFNKRGHFSFHKGKQETLGETRRRTLEEKKKEECAQRDGRTPTASCNVAVAFPVCHGALHHRWVFLQVPLPSHPPPSEPPSPSPSSVPSLPPGPPAASLIYWFSAARRAINHGNGGRRWLGCGVQREKREKRGRMDWRRRRRGEGRPSSLVYRRQVTDGVCFSEACTCAGGRFSWVLHKGAMGVPGPRRSLEDT